MHSLVQLRLEDFILDNKSHSITPSITKSLYLFT